MPLRGSKGSLHVEDLTEEEDKRNMELVRLFGEDEATVAWPDILAGAI